MLHFVEFLQTFRTIPSLDWKFVTIVSIKILILVREYVTIWLLLQQSQSSLNIYENINCTYFFYLIIDITVFNCNFISVMEYVLSNCSTLEIMLLDSVFEEVTIHTLYL